MISAVVRAAYSVRSPPTFGLALLGASGLLLIRKSFEPSSEAKFGASRGSRLVLASLSINLDSLGVGIALPELGIPLLPLLVTVSITTTFCTLIGASG